MNADGTIKTTLLPGRSRPDWAAGDESLSESLGLWLLYALESDDKNAFAAGTDQLLTHFWTDGWIAWKRTPDGARAATNALVDDLRIAEALYAAAERWGVPDYIRLADQIADSLQSRQTQNGLLADHFDREAQRSGRQLTVSYINPVPLAVMASRGRLAEETRANLAALLAGAQPQHGFFPFSCDLRSGDCLYHAEVNLIDQILIAYHRQRMGVASDELWPFLQREWQEEGRLFGRYDAATGQPIVTYESPAVYGLLMLYAIEAGEPSFAASVRERLRTLQTLAPGAPFVGGFMDAGDTHAFDNLIPLLAERSMLVAPELP